MEMKIERWRDEEMKIDQCVYHPVCIILSELRGDKMERCRDNKMEMERWRDEDGNIKR